MKNYILFMSTTHFKMTKVLPVIIVEPEEFKCLQRHSRREKQKYDYSTSTRSERTTAWKISLIQEKSKNKKIENIEPTCGKKTQKKHKKGSVLSEICAQEIYRMRRQKGVDGWKDLVADNSI